ncbi:MAG: flagellar basal body P-ring formation chaperone FlgA [Myxococcota bacterium]
MIFLLASTAWAATPVEDALSSWAVASCAAVKVEVEHLGLAESLIDEAAAAEGLTWQFEGDPCRSRPSLSVTAWSGDQKLWSVRSQPSLVVWVQRRVAERVYAEGDLVVGQLQTVRLDNVVGTAADAGWEATRTIQPGTLLTASVAKPVPDVRDGDAVTVIVQRGAVRLSAPGTAMKDAHEGDEIDVINEWTHRRVRGVLGPGKQVVVQ